MLGGRGGRRVKGVREALDTWREDTAVFKEEKQPM